MDNKKDITDYKHSPAKRLAMKIKKNRAQISKANESDNEIVTEAVTKYERKYQCPYCDEKKEKLKLISHIEKRHPEYIPEGYTATRIVFNIINKKQKGTCVICGKESPWNEDKGRYDRFCSNKCKKQYEEIAAERLKRVRGMTKQEMLKDPEYQNNVMLANRGISGKYKFQDGTIRTYVGSYERRFLEFMDIFLNVKSEDLETPGPIIEYKYKGETHKWITDAYYAPYNLVFDIKDGGDNPNNRNMPEYRAKQDAKEAAIKKQGKYNYLRLTDNKFEQLIELMMELKELYIENNGEYTPIVRINESVEEDSDYLNESYIIDEIYDEEDDTMNENYLINKKDIYYNKDKFDSGEINLCFITGHSGSGKSTMGHSMENKKNIECYELDDLIFNWNFSDENLKEYGNLIYSFFKGPGKRYRYTNKKDWDNDSTWDNKDEYVDGYEASLIMDFVKYAISYAKYHKDTKFVLEGIWIFCFFDPKELDKYAVYIKGTSMLISKIRAAKRDSKDAGNKFNQVKAFTKQMSQSWKNYLNDEKMIMKFYNYFSSKINNESSINEVKAKYLGPKVCPKCGSKNIGVFFKGEPIYQCKDCGKYLGVVPFKHESTNFVDMYFISANNMDNKVLIPRIPSNYFTKNNYEDSKTPRVCFAPSIDQCLMGLSENLKDREFYVHTPIEGQDLDIYKPSTKEVPDSKITGEIWIKNKIKVKCIGKIKVIKDKGLPGKKFKYGDKEAELYDWEYEWIDKIDESTILYDKGYYKLLDTYKDPKYCSWDEEQTYSTIDLCIKSEKCYGKDMYCYSLDPDTYKITYIGKLHVSELEDEGYSIEWIDKVNEATILKPSTSKPSKEGFMGRGSWNPIKRVNGEPYRERVEAIIFNKELTKVLISVDSKGVRIPGGGTMKNKSLEGQLIKECQEEVRVNIDNIKYIGEYALEGKMVPEDEIYKGKYTYAYLATYDSDYKGYIRPEDESSMIKSAKWYDIHEAMRLLKQYNIDIYILFCNEYKEYIENLMVL